MRPTQKLWKCLLLECFFVSFTESVLVSILSLRSLRPAITSISQELRSLGSIWCQVDECTFPSVSVLARAVLPGSILEGWFSVATCEHFSQHKAAAWIFYGCFQAAVRPTLASKCNLLAAAVAPMYRWSHSSIDCL